MRTFGSQRRWRLGLAVAAGVAAASVVPARGAVTLSPVIVQGASADAAHNAVQAVITAGHAGTITADLPLVNGVAAKLTAAEISQLLSPLVVTPDATVLTAMAPAKGGTPAPPPTPRVLDSVFPDVTGARTLAHAGQDGSGIGVAVIDTGIANLPDFSGRLRPGVDLTTEKNPWLDGYGHGTFIAGLVAGSGVSSSGTYVGEAPGALLIPVKVAGKSGSTSVSTLIQGLQWVETNRSAEKIRVINLSVGAIPQGPTALNPLDQAVEKLWLDGVTVVVSAGNIGPTQGTITSPGDDPLVITVGALDDKDTVAASDDTVPDFSSHGPTSSDAWWKPDLLAPGKSVVSVTPTTSYIWNTYKSARVGSKNFVGSGTSFSAAITSGAVAMYLQTHTSATPDSVKAALLTTTDPGPGDPNSLADHDPFAQGHGVLNIERANREPALNFGQDVSAILPVPAGTLISLASRQCQTWATGNPADALCSATPVLFPFAPYSFVDSSAGAFESKAWNSAAWDSKAWNNADWDSKAWNNADWNSKAWNSKAWNNATWS